MDWQQPVALWVVGITAVLLLWRRFRPRKAFLAKHPECGCGLSGASPPQGSIVLHARKGERPHIMVKSK